MDLISTKKKQLVHGGKIPVLGLGVWQAAAGEETRRAVQEALSCGYRLIDTARIYGNEKDVGEAVREEGVRRISGFDPLSAENHLRTQNDRGDEVGDPDGRGRVRRV